MSSFIIGVASGVVASSLIALLVVLAKRLIAPWIQGLLHDDPVVSGDWQVFYSDTPSARSVGHMTVKHFGKTVTGTADLVRNRSGQEVARRLLMRGTMRGGQVLATYEDAQLRGQIVGVVLLQLTDRDKLVGKSVYCHPTQTAVEAYDLCLKR